MQGQGQNPIMMSEKEILHDCLSSQKFATTNYNILLANAFASSFVAHF